MQMLASNLKTAIILRKIDKRLYWMLYFRLYILKMHQGSNLKGGIVIKLTETASNFRKIVLLF